MRLWYLDRISCFWNAPKITAKQFCSKKAFVNINIAWGYFLHIIERTMVLQNIKSMTANEGESFDVIEKLRRTEMNVTKVTL